MRHSQSTESPPPTFKQRRDENFSYAAPQHGEALATLRYGVETRKGLILLTGVAGTGKSTLLQRLARELDPGVTFLRLGDPHLSFSEIVRCLLRGLTADTGSDDDVVLLRQYQTILRGYSAAGRLISIAFDDAHHMRDAVLELVLQTFVGVGSEGTRSHLAQVILVGRPELAERLSRPPLRSATTPVALECRLSPLTDKEVGEYIKYRLRSAALPVDLIQPAAMTSIALYSGGNFQLVNALYDRAFHSTERSVRKQIGADRIDKVAKDLDLWQPQWVRKEEPETNFATLRGHDDVYRFSPPDEDTTESVGRTFLHLSGFDDSHRRFRARGSRVRFKKILLAAILALPGLWVYGELAKNSPTDWSGMLGDAAGKSRQLLAQAENIFAGREGVKPPDAAAPIPDSERFPATIEERETNVTPPLKMEELMPPLTMPEGQDNPEPEEAPKSPPQAIARAKKIPQKFSNRPGKDVASQISKAIENRAIAGVYVTVREDIAYLDGRVATERQRRAAERAARNVGEVRSVRNRIDVE